MFTLFALAAFSNANAQEHFGPITDSDYDFGDPPQSSPTNGYVINVLTVVANQASPGDLLTLCNAEICVEYQLNLQNIFVATRYYANAAPMSPSGGSGGYWAPGAGVPTGNVTGTVTVGEIVDDDK